MELLLTQFKNIVRGVLGPYPTCALLTMLKSTLELECLRLAEGRDETQDRNIELQ